MNIYPPLPSLASPSGALSPVCISDFRTGSELIVRIPISNPSAAAPEIEGILDALLAASLDHEMHFRLLELLLKPATHVIEELAKRYESKPLPFGETEEIPFQRTESILVKMLKAYALCIKSVPLDASSRPARLATLLHRCIHFTGMRVLEHFRARRQLPKGLWLRLHKYYGTAESMRVDKQNVPGIPETSIKETHCAATYLAFILCDMAGNYNLALRDQIQVRHWAFDWSRRVSLHPATAGEKSSLFIIDPTQDFSLTPSAKCARGTPIYSLDTTELLSYLNIIRRKLRQGELPASLSLKDERTPQQYATLIKHLMSRWQQALVIRGFKRYAASGSIQVSAGFEDMHYMVSGKAFQQPDSANVYSRNDFDSIYALRFQENPSSQGWQKVSYLGTDEWNAVDQSANGFRMLRSLSGRRMTFGQLLALRLHDSEHAILAHIAWLTQEDNKDDKEGKENNEEKEGCLMVGISTLPGLPTAIAVRPFAAAMRHELYQRAFLMSSPKQEHAEQTLVLPAGMYALEKVIEVFSDKPWRAKLTEMTESGSDFECVKFEVQK